MKCNEREKLFLFVHRMLDAHGVDDVRSHIARCAECNRAAKEYRKLSTALDDWGAAEPSPRFDARVHARMASGSRKEHGFFGFGRVRALMTGVASVVLMVGVLVVLHRRYHYHTSQPEVSQQLPQASTASPPAQTIEAQKQPLPAEEQLKVDENLSLLEDYDVVSNFDVLSELPQASDN